MQHWLALLQASGARHPERSLGPDSSVNRQEGYRLRLLQRQSSAGAVYLFDSGKGRDGKTGLRCLPCLAARRLQGRSVDCPRVGALQFAWIVDEQPGLQHRVIGQAIEVGFGNADFA